MTCEIQSAGTIELYFYGELPLADRPAVQAHLKQCAECRQALEDLTDIRAALAMRPDVATPPGGDWSSFMARLNDAVQNEQRPPAQSARVISIARSRRVAPYLALAATLALVTVSVALVVRARRAEAPAPAVAATARPVSSAIAEAGLQGRRHNDPALGALSDQHFERSKLVVLGLTTKDATKPDEDDWAYERELASGLLNDTRLYRLAAEQRGMTALAGTMRDLELVLLQTSMSQKPDDETLQQLQRLIRRRDLLTKMDVVYARGF
jgi:hypothetical protein